MPAPRDVHRYTTLTMSALMFAIGIVLLVLTFVQGGGIASTGTIVGVLFVAAGAGRFLLARRAR